MEIEFFKYVALLNDFVLIDDRSNKIAKKIGYSKLARAMLLRKSSIGADGLVVVQKSVKKNVDIKFLYFNPDGSEAEMCGNAMRCFGSYCRSKGKIWDVKKDLFVETKVGVSKLTLLQNKNDVRVNIGPAKIINKFLEIDLGNEGTFKCSQLFVGVPHLVVHLSKKLEESQLKRVGSLLENHKLFPDRTNVMFCRHVDSKNLELQSWERGTGITYGCGSGSAACLVANCLANEKMNSKATVTQQGGAILVEWKRKTNEIFLTGGAKFVFKGMFEMH